MLNYQQWSFEKFSDINSGRDLIYFDDHNEAINKIVSEHSSNGDKSFKLKRNLTNTPSEYSYIQLEYRGITEEDVGKVVTVKADIYPVNCSVQLALMFFRADYTNVFNLTNVPQSDNFSLVEVSKELISDINKIGIRLQIPPSQNNCQVYADNISLNIQ